MDSVVRKLLLSAIACLCTATARAQPAANTARYTDVVTQIDTGHFQQADAQLARWLASASAPAGANDQDLRFQRERMRRIRLDFALDETAAKEKLRYWIPDLRNDEFARWDDQGLLEHLDIDSQRWYFNRAPSNLFRLSAEARARRRADAPMPRDGPYEALTPYHADVVAAAARTGHAWVLPQRVEVTQSLVVKADAVPAGETVRAWIPYPREIPGQQEQLQWIGSVPASARIAPAATQQRTAYLEATAVAGQPTQFNIRYALTVSARHTAIDAARVLSTPR